MSKSPLTTPQGVVAASQMVDTVHIASVVTGEHYYSIVS